MAGRWREVLLEDVAADVTVGHVGPMAAEYVEQGIPFLRSQNVEPLRINDTDLKFITNEFHNRLKKSALSPGDVVIVRTGKPGACAVIPPTLPVANCSDLVIVRCGDALDPRFLAYYVNSVAVHHVNSHLVGAVQQHFNVGSARKMLMRLPDLPEQRAIDHILGTLDDKIELNRRMSETLEAIARALFKSWFVDFDPVRPKVEGRDPGLPEGLADLFPACLVDSELGEIPKGWEVTSIGAVAEVIDCLHSKKPERRDSGLPLLQLVNIRDDGLLDMTDTYLISEADYRQWISRMEASPGDCVITNVGRVGAVSQIPAGQKAALGRNMTGVRCRRDFPFPTVLIEVLLSRAMKDEMTRKMDTGTILDALNVRNIPRLRFVRGTHDVLALFEKSSRPLRARMEALAAESRTLAALRDALLPKLISGELRLKDAEKFTTREIA
jgi:type I restriction enzyme S subunit